MTLTLSLVLLVDFAPIVIPSGAAHPARVGRPGQKTLAFYPISAFAARANAPLLFSSAEYDCAQAARSNKDTQRGRPGERAGGPLTLRPPPARPAPAFMRWPRGRGRSPWRSEPSSWPFVHFSPAFRRLPLLAGFSFGRLPRAASHSMAVLCRACPRGACPCTVASQVQWLLSEVDPTDWRGESVLASAFRERLGPDARCTLHPVPPFPEAPGYYNHSTAFHSVCILRVGSPTSAQVLTFPSKEVRDAAFDKVKARRAEASSE